MATAQDHPPSPESLRRGYEVHGVNARGLVIFLICFVLTAVVIHWGLWVMAKAYARWSRPADVPRSAVPQVSPFQDPRLQPSEEHPRQPYQDLQDMRDQNRQIFERLGWQTDPATGTPHIPDDIVSQLASRATTRPAGGEK